MPAQRARPRRGERSCNPVVVGRNNAANDRRVAPAAAPGARAPAPLQRIKVGDSPGQSRRTKRSNRPGSRPPKSFHPGPVEVDAREGPGWRLCPGPSPGGATSLLLLLLWPIGRKGARSSNRGQFPGLRSGRSVARAPDRPTAGSFPVCALADRSRGRPIVQPRAVSLLLLWTIGRKGRPIVQPRAVSLLLLWPIGRKGRPIVQPRYVRKWCRMPDLNQRPHHYE